MPVVYKEPPNKTYNDRIIVERVKGFEHGKFNAYKVEGASAGTAEFISMVPGVASAGYSHSAKAVLYSVESAKLTTRKELEIAKKVVSVARNYIEGSTLKWLAIRGK